MPFCEAVALQSLCVAVQITQLLYLACLTEETRQFRCEQNAIPLTLLPVNHLSFGRPRIQNILQETEKADDKSRAQPQQQFQSSSKSLAFVEEASNSVATLLIQIWGSQSKQMGKGMLLDQSHCKLPTGKSLRYPHAAMQALTAFHSYPT